MLMLTLAGVNTLPTVFAWLQDNPRFRNCLIASFLVLGVSGIVLNDVEGSRARQQQKELPKEVGEYLKNHVPAFARRHRESPGPLVVYADGDIKGRASNLASDLFNFLAAQGEPPRQRPNESLFDFVVRSNAWYDSVMAEYDAQFADQVNGVVKDLVAAGLLDQRVQLFAKNPVNPLGISEVAFQLQASAQTKRKA